MSNEDGAPFARMTESMEQQLSIAEFKTLAVLRRLIPDGERRELSIAAIARDVRRISKGRLLSAIRVMDGRFIICHPSSDLPDGSVLIEMLLPPELREEPAP
jgi:hypothetical protein